MKTKLTTKDRKETKIYSNLDQIKKQYEDICIIMVVHKKWTKQSNVKGQERDRSQTNIFFKKQAKVQRNKYTCPIVNVGTAKVMHAL